MTFKSEAEAKFWRRCFMAFVSRGSACINAALAADNSLQMLRERIPEHGFVNTVTETVDEFSKTTVHVRRPRPLVGRSGPPRPSMPNVNETIG